MFCYAELAMEGRGDRCGLTGFIKYNKSFCSSTQPSVTMGCAGFKIDAVSLLQCDGGLAADKFQLAFEDEEEFFSSVVIVNDIIRFAFLHMDNKRFHIFFDLGVCEWLVLIAYICDVWSFYNTIPVLFTHDDDI